MTFDNPIIVDSPSRKRTAPKVVGTIKKRNYSTYMGPPVHNASLDLAYFKLIEANHS